jgi:hypothetical protein
VIRLNREIAQYLDAPEIRQRLYSFGLATEGAGTPETAAQFIRADQDEHLRRKVDVQPQ